MPWRRERTIFALGRSATAARGQPTKSREDAVEIVMLVAALFRAWWSRGRSVQVGTLTLYLTELFGGVVLEMTP